LEAAIGIEPMNKGFAVSGRLFTQVLVDAVVCVFIGVSTFRLFVCSPKFETVSPGKDPRVLSLVQD